MKPTELRIGNYVNYIFKTLSIDAPEYKIKNGADIQLHQSNNLYKPIPLTDQWLKDLGLETKDNDEHMWFIMGYAVYEFLFDGKFLYYASNTPGINTKIEYVHHFQNLYFALTGEELIK